MNSTWRAALAGCLILPALLAQTKSKTPAADWPMYNRDLGSSRYSPLTQVNTQNVATLKEAWSYKLQDNRFRFTTAGGTAESVPIVISGVMYLSAQTRVVALEPDTGKEIWVYEKPGMSASARGLAYWPGDKQNPPRVIFTSGKELIGLNAKTGKLDPGFGREGIVDMIVPYNGVPTILKNVVMVGASTGEKENGPPGNTRAFSAQTGVKMWEFQSIPKKGELGNDTWLNDGWKDRSGANIWGWYMTADEERGIVYMPFGAPAANYYGGDRPGANLFGNSVVAVDAQTGKYKWHFQVVHHDLWDYDLPPAGGLVDITVKGKKIPAIAQIGKSGWMFILDRTTGKPVFGVEERPVPKGDVPGEWYSPTQPFPLKPPALARTSFRREDLVTAEDTTPEHAKACAALYDQGLLYNDGPFTPWVYHEEGGPNRYTVSFPGATGGASWGGVASDPKTGYVFVATKDSPLAGWVEKKVPGKNYENANLPYDRAGQGPTAAPITGVAAAGGNNKKEKGGAGNVPCFRPPWAALTAVNANTGEFAWRVPLGTNQNMPEGKKNVGGAGSSGPMVTAGGLVFVGAGTDNRFRAFDSKNGKELWAYQLDRQANAIPMTYQAKNGKQYVAVTASDTVHVFVLP